MSNDTDQPPSQPWLRRLLNLFKFTPQSTNDIISELRKAHENGLIHADLLPMLEGVLQVSSMQARDIMIPRSEMTVIQQGASLAEILPVVIESAHSRFPVIGEDRDDVEGILLAKDLLRYHQDVDNNSDRFDGKDILRPAIVIPESKRLDILLKQFRVSRNHMAIVVDEYGGVSGLVTIEDVLEQIVGDIEDEHDFDDDDDNIKHIRNNEYTLKARTDIDDFNEYFSTSWSAEEVDTVGGMVVQAFGHLPERNERIVIDNFKFKVLHADGRRVRLLHLTVLDK